MQQLENLENEQGNNWEMQQLEHEQSNNCARIALNWFTPEWILKQNNSWIAFIVSQNKFEIGLLCVWKNISQYFDLNDKSQNKSE